MNSTKEYLADKFPDLISDWHPIKNGSLSPYNIAPQSNKIVWWRCSKGHEWKAAVANRTGQNKTGCPYCFGRKPTKNNNFASLFPNLLEEWDFEKNVSVDPSQLLPFSHKKVWWRCKKGHEWKTGIAYRTKQGSNCPYCSGRLAGSDNSLAVLYPNLAKQWHPKKNGYLRPEDVRPGTDKKIWWLCEKGHEWEASVCHRTDDIKATGCPYCSGRNATAENNLAVLYPELLNEWNYQKNSPLRPDMLKLGSNRKVWWQCNRGHEWKTSPNKRTGIDKTGCPFCNPQTSRIEIRILCELKYLFENIEWRKKLNNIEVDIFIPKYLFAVEVDGYRWHLGKEEKDELKGKELNKQGVKLLRLRDNKLKSIDASDTFCCDNDDDFIIIKRLLVNIMKYISLNQGDIKKIQSYLEMARLQNDLEYERLIAYLPSPPPERSLAMLYEHLAREWHYEKNKPLTPDLFTPSARAMVWWKCPNGHEYKSYLYSRIRGVGCPYCAGKKVCNDNSLATLKPDLSKEWHPIKNDNLTPNDVTISSNKKVWWKCKKGHEWQTAISHRSNGRGCPYCSNKLINGDNSLQALHPDIAKEWHPTKNKGQSPNEIASGSSKKVWWRCDKGHEWKTSPSSRSGKNNSGCPYCAGNVASEGNNLLIAFPAIATQWHYDKNFPLTPEQVTPRSGKKFWWICNNNHVWEASVSNRTRLNATSCPYCVNNKATANNNFAVKFPELLKQWDYEKNASIDPSQLLPGSNKKVWWRCSQGHGWETMVNHRTGKHKTGCPYCAGQKTSSDNNLTVKAPNLLEEWNYKKMIS